MVIVPAHCFLNLADQMPCFEPRSAATSAARYVMTRKLELTRLLPVT